MGHAGAIVGGSDDTAEAKKQIMRECGIHVVILQLRLVRVKEVMDN
jgi:succinyl-CoA synthetase alpha subunit